MSTSISDTELVQEVNSGSESAFELLVDRFSRQIYSLALRFTQNREDAEDVLQEVFVAAHAKLSGFQGKAQLSSWIYRIAVNCSLMKLRKRSRSRLCLYSDFREAGKDFLDQHFVEYKTPDKSLALKRANWALECAIAELAAELRTVFVLRDVDGLSTREVGRLLKLSVPTVKSRLHRARLSLRAKLHQRTDLL